MVRYAKRVRHIRIMALRQTISPFIYGSIGRLLGGQFLTLIPALNSFDIPNITELSNDHIQCLFLLPCSMISDVTICGIGNQISEVIAASLIDGIAQTSRIVKTLKLGGRITSISLNMIHQFERLETLRLNMESTPFSRQILYGISQMTALKRVSLNFDGSCTFPIPSSPRTSDFPSLQHLEISSSAQIAMMISLYITTPRLNFLTLHFSSLGLDTNSPGKCLQRITDMANFLKSIQITSSDVNTCIPGADLACLGSCPLLEHINISVDYLTAQTFPAGLEQWPSVKYMRLVSKKVTPQLRSGPLKSLPLVLSQLNQILSLCPKLETLLISIVLDTGPAGIEAMRMQTSSSQAHSPRNTMGVHSLKELVFLPFADTQNVIDENSSEKALNAFTVSRFIDCTCPYIKNFDLSQLTYINRDWWDGVQAMVKELQQMRNPPKKLSNKKIKENRYVEPFHLHDKHILTLKMST